MARLMGIDFGTKRVGLAETDPLQLIASPLTTVANADALSYIVDYCKANEVETLVIGEPKRLHNEASEVEKDIQEFITKLQQAIPQVGIARVDERFTSKMAFQSMLDAGVKKKKRREKGLLDQTSAAIILQSYLDAKSL